ncbi:MAG: serine protease [bacterium]
MRIQIILSIVIFLLCANLSGKTASANNFCVCKSDEETGVFQETLRKNEENIVYIYSENKEGKFINAGTGFVYDKSGLIATARHVVDNPSATSVKVVIKKNKQFIVKKAAWHFDDMDYDVSILRIDYTFDSQVRLRTSELESGEKLYSLGFPMTHPSSGANERKITRTYGRFFKYVFQKISNELKKEEPKFDLMQVSTLPVAPGYSGVPVFDKSGQAVGVVSLNMPISPFGTVFAWSVRIERLVELAKKQNILNTMFP